MTERVGGIGREGIGPSCIRRTLIEPGALAPAYQDNAVKLRDALVSNMSLRIERIEWETIDTQKLKGATAMQYYFAVAAFWSRNVEQVLWETAKSPHRQHTFDA
ncbi:hypothetical protein ALC56_11393 [Trachymyrmex septentrionalis]|uniref:Uncharacterized protein n=1 Tax=Trachymyrmex septentrionalis TaxID=34720 RepID=A0A195F1N0_9HYME|nr:hypothetical protein ALC56_11393 [Trachymyrmex septentrionalis]